MSISSLLFRLRPHLLPIFVWLLALAGVGFLFSRRTQRFEVLGVAAGLEYQVTTNCPARISGVYVQLFDTVTKGRTVAVVDTVLDNEKPRGELKAQLATTLAEIEHLTAQLVPTQDSLSAEKSAIQTSRISDERRFSVDVENARLDVLRLRGLIQTDKIMLEDLAMDVKITKDLVDQEAVVPYELQKVQAQYDSLAKKIEENERLLEQAEAAFGKAQDRLNEYVKNQPYHPSIDDAVEVIRKAIRVQERRMDELLAQIEALDERSSIELQAPFDGIVSRIFRRESETILAGEPILTITQTQPTEIIAYADESQLNSVHEGMSVELIKSSEPAQIARSHVTQVGPKIEQLPTHLWRNPNVPQWGRPFRIEVPAQMILTVGEVVGIRRL